MSAFKRCRCSTEIILARVRWYCRYGIDYRDLAEMMHHHGGSHRDLQLLQR